MEYEEEEGEVEERSVEERDIVDGGSFIAHIGYYNVVDVGIDGKGVGQRG